MLPHFNFSENEWAALGPGSSECIRKIFGPSIRGHEEAALRWLYETQMSHFARLRIPKSRIPRLCTARPAGMTMVDIEHALCECEKYSREKHPEIKGKHSVVGNPFKPSSKPITAHLPEKWLNPPPRLQPLPRPPPVRLAEDADDLPEYEVSHIVTEKSKSKSSANSGGRRYLVRWTGWAQEDDTWMSAAELAKGAAELLEEWEGMKRRIEERIDRIRG